MGRCWSAGHWLWVLLIVSLACSAGADEERFITVSDAPPPGFEALTEAQITQADIYFGGQMMTTALVEFDPTTVTIIDPIAVLEAIPNVRDPEKLALMLRQPLPHNVEYLCREHEHVDCAQLQPEVVDVLFDADRFRLDLFIAPDELLVSELEYARYLPESTSGWSMLNNIRTNLSGVGSDRTYRLASESILAYRHSRLRSRYAFTDDGATLSGLSVAHDAKDFEYEAGSFRTLGRNVSFTADVDVVGARVATSSNTRTDLAEALGTPLFVFLHERSRVDVFRGDELIDSRYYDAGNQQIDTREFPDGAYDVTLKVTGINGSVSEDSHFFVRSGELPPEGEPSYYVEAGTIVDTFEQAVPQATGETWLRAGASHRLSKSFAMSSELLHAGGKSVAQTGLFAIHRRGYVYGGAMASDRGDFGASLRAGWNSRRLSAHLDVRAVEAVAQRMGFNPVSDSYTQATATVAVPLKKGRLMGRARFSDRQGTRQTEVGLSYWSTLIRRKGWSVDLNLDAQVTEGRGSVRAGVQFRWHCRRSSAVARPQMALQSGTQDAIDGQFDGRWSRAYQTETMGEIDQSVFLSESSTQRVVGTRFEAPHSPLSDLEFGYQSTSGETNSYYAANNHFSVATANGRTTLSRSRGSAGAVVIHIDGNTNEKFEVIVNDRVVGFAWPNQGKVISLRPYETYRVRVKPAGAGIVGFDERTHTLTLYPGNVQELNFTANALVVLVGQLVDGTGSPLAHARFNNVQGWGASDANGWFQVEAKGLQPLQITMSDGQSCQAALPEVEAEEGLAMVDVLQCVRTPTRAIR